MGAAICQSNTNPEALKAEATENEGGKCMFDVAKSNVNLRLRMLSFASRENKKSGAKLP